MSEKFDDISYRNEREEFRAAIRDAVLIDQQKLSEAIDDVLPENADTWRLNGRVADEICVEIGNAAADSAAAAYDEYVDGGDYDG